MRKVSPVFITLIALALALSACGAPAAAPPAAAPTSVPPTAAPPTAAPTEAPTQVPTLAPTEAAPVPATGGGTMVNVGKNDALGSFLVDDKGMTLYLFTKDTPNSNASTCYNKCEASWPPLLTSGAPVAGEGLDASKFGTLQRTDGSTQVTYNGWPLYYYAKDAKAGDTAGQGVGGVWFVISPAGVQVQAQQGGTSY